MLVVNGLLNWLLGLFGFSENIFSSSSISDYSNNDRPWPLLYVIWAIFIGFVLLLLHLAETKLSNGSFNGNEEDHSFNLAEELLKEEEQLSDQVGHGLVAVEQPPDHYWTTNNGGGRRYGACAFCGGLSTTRCSRCKAVKYCSERCQILHWRAVHKYDCTETTQTVDQESHSHEDSKMVKTEKEGSKEMGVVEWNSQVRDTDSTHNATRKPTEASSDALRNCFTCAVCGGPATTRCSRCKNVGYCSVKCLIEDWGWHKVKCTIAEDVDSTQTERPPPGNVGLLKNSYEEEDNDHSPESLSLVFYPEGTTDIKPLGRSSQEPTMKAQDHTVEGVRFHEDEIAKFRNEIIFLKAERDEWAMRANFAKQRYQNFKEESEHQVVALKNEKKMISNAEAQARNVVHNLSERLQGLQTAVQASFAEKKKQEEYIQILERKCAELKRELQEEWEHIHELVAERDESHKTAQIAMRQVEEKVKELQVEQERVQLLKEDFCRDVAAAESRALIAEAKLRDLDRKIRSKNDKVAVWTDSLGRPAMACAICLTNEKDLAFGCGHMTCRDCGSKISKCPICREQITSFVRLYPG